MNTTIASLKGAPAKGLRVVTVGGFLLASLGVCAAAEAQQTQAVEKKTEKKEVVNGELAPTTIMANRMETDLSKVGSSVTVLDAAELEKQGVYTLRDALKYVPGVISNSPGGQRGSYSYVNIRGMEAKDTSVIVDGMRISGGPDQFLSQYFLGSSTSLGLSRVEVLRGPQGVQYGADSMGGVIGLYSAKGEGEFSGQLGLEAGSFDSWNSVLGMQGQEGDLSYSLSLGYEQTENDTSQFDLNGRKEDNDFEMFSYALRLDYAVNEKLNIGLTLRGADSTYEGPDFSGFGADVVDTDYTLGTVYAEYEVSEFWTSKLTVGLYKQETFFDQEGTYFHDEEMKKNAIYWDNTLHWNEAHTTLLGLSYEDSSYTGDTPISFWGGGRVSNDRDQTALYLNHIWDVSDNLTFSGGVRWEQYKETRKEQGGSWEKGFDDSQLTWRTSVAYTVEATDTILRGSVGSGFRLPTVSQIVGNPGGFAPILPNENLNPQESLGWDLGVEQPFYDGQYRVGVTYFSNRVDGQIYNSGNQFVNSKKIDEISGVESFVEANFLDDRLNVALTYTWLDRSSLLDLPDNVASLRLNGKITNALEAGVTASYMDSRTMGAHDNAYAGNMDSYVLVNLYGNYKITENVMLTARVDNLFDTDYEVFNQPAQGGMWPSPEVSWSGRGIGFFGGVTFTF